MTADRPRFRLNRLRRICLWVAVGWFLWMDFPLNAEVGSRQKVAFDLAAGDAAQTLKQFADQSREQIVFMVNSVRGERTNAVSGERVPRMALEELLDGTELVIVQDDRSGAILVTRRPSVRNSQPQTTLVPALDSDETAEETGAIRGRVSNRIAGVYLEGARVEIVGTTHAALTNREGYFRFSGLDPGEVILSITYTGLDPFYSAVPIVAAHTVFVNVELTSELYRMDEYQVTGSREGQAAAVTRQRNAPNLMTVAATDTFGNVADGNIAEFAKRLPGVAAELQQNEAFRVIIRGMQSSLNSVTFNGMQLPAAPGTGREININEFPIGSIEMIEVTKSPTPDMDGDSIGGSVNLVPKSAFDRVQPRRITYTASANFRVNIQRNETTPSFSFSYSDVLGNEKRLGIMLTGSSSGNYQPQENINLEYNNIPEVPTYLTLFRLLDSSFLRNRSGGGVKLDYRIGEDSLVYLNLLHSNYGWAQRQRRFTIANINQVAALDADGIPVPLQPQFPHGHPGYVPAGFATDGARVRAGILPGYSTEVTRTVNSTVELARLERSGATRNYVLQTGGRGQLGDWELDFTGTFSTGRAYTGVIPNTAATVRGTGWILDGSRDLLFREITQIEGPDFLDPDNWALDYITHTRRFRRNDVYGGEANARRDFHEPIPAYLKAGVKFRNQKRSLWDESRRYRYVGPDGVAGVHPVTGVNDDNLNQFADHDYRYGPIEGRYAPPLWLSHEALNAVVDRQPGWVTEDVAFHVQQALAGAKQAEEAVLAGYFMGGFTLARFSALAGLRLERTAVKGTGVIRDRGATAGIDDPVDRVRAEYSGRQSLRRHYLSVLPGVHLKLDSDQGWVFRMAYAASLGRPDFGVIIPDRVVDVENERVRQNNPAVRPQTSDNFDLSVERYFEPVGLFSAGLFLKEIRSYIHTSRLTVPFGPDNGYGGQYAGWELVSQENGGFARVRGFELGYQQQLSFLPGRWSGLGVYANYSFLEAFGNYGNISEPATSELAEFIPQVMNAGLSYSRSGVSARAHVHYLAPWLFNYHLDPMLKEYQASKMFVDVNLEIALSRRHSLFLDVQNLFNERHNDRYRGYRDRPSAQQYLGTRLSVGVSGRF